ncbi:protein arginine N-methyltransferase 2 [Apiospora kogelbergensis]|uniref:Arginine N-methyltransferase 2 n=1 Tax=Apiospora kogelbergensis TaxID=1337665 RepID=A0AAW0QVY6_9PEZI
MGEPSKNQDALEARIPPTCPASISQILSQAWHHDLASLKPLLDVPGRASVQEPTTGETPLHAAIRSCGPAGAGAVDLEAAKSVLEELFFNGAIWNDVDSKNETPGCVAARLGQKELYEMCVGAGVRAELLFGLLEGYEELESMDEDGDEDEEVVDITDAADGEEIPDLVVETNSAGQPTEKPTEEVQRSEKKAEEEETEILESNPDRAFVPPNAAEAQASQVESAEYLRSNLTYSAGKLTDASANGVMMAWETSIMRLSVDSLLPEQLPGRKVLNIGFGMGIIDGMFAATKPSRHHIIEAHPDVLSHIATSPDCKFGPAWESSAAQEGAYKVHAGKWQDVVPKLLEAGETYDAIYFDTFGEDYSQLRMFFTEHVPGLLEEEGRFGFFNGLGADRQVCYDVYTKVVEMHLSDAGMDVAWQEMDVDMQGLNEEGKGEWEGVKRRYWTLNSEFSFFFLPPPAPF